MVAVGILAGLGSGCGGGGETGADQNAEPLPPMPPVKLEKGADKDENLNAQERRAKRLEASK
jgi:hypothetical protein